LALGSAIDGLTCFGQFLIFVIISACCLKYILNRKAKNRNKMKDCK